MKWKLGLYRGLCGAYMGVYNELHRDNGKESGNYRGYRCCIGIIGCILRLHWGNGRENGNYYIIVGYLGVFWG